MLIYFLLISLNLLRLFFLLLFALLLLLLSSLLGFLFFGGLLFFFVELVLELKNISVRNGLNRKASYRQDLPWQPSQHPSTFQRFPLRILWPPPHCP
jgi:flagellar biosynthesis protein FlhB